jgi:hypothetical protein
VEGRKYSINESERDRAKVSFRRVRYSLWETEKQKSKEIVERCVCLMGTETEM